jgi:exosortase
VSFGLLSLLALPILHGPTTLLLRGVEDGSIYSHIFIIAPLSMGIIYLERTRVFAVVKSSPRLGICLGIIAFTIAAMGRLYMGSLSANDQLSVAMLASVFLWIGAFLICYGWGAAQAALFPLLFLLLLIPLPDFLLSRVVFGLQQGSSQAACFLFKLAGIPVLQNGVVLSLPGVDIEVAEQCSGIRSSLILLVVGLIFAHWFLASIWKKVFVMALVVPITVMKNGIRIFTLTMLATYVDPSFIDGNLHHRGGIVFFALALVIVLVLVWMLRNSETRSRLRLLTNPPPVSSSQAALR